MECTPFYFLVALRTTIYIGRIPNYTTLHGYVVLPWLIDQIFEEQSARLVKVLMILFYAVFHYYQMAIAWTLL